MLVQEVSNVLPIVNLPIPVQIEELFFNVDRLPSDPGSTPSDQASHKKRFHFPQSRLISYEKEVLAHLERTLAGRHFVIYLIHGNRETGLYRLYVDQYGPDLNRSLKLTDSPKQVAPLKNVAHALAQMLEQAELIGFRGESADSKPYLSPFPVDGGRRIAGLFRPVFRYQGREYEAVLQHVLCNDYFLHTLFPLDAFS